MSRSYDMNTPTGRDIRAIRLGGQVASLAAALLLLLAAPGCGESSPDAGSGKSDASESDTGGAVGGDISDEDGGIVGNADTTAAGVDTSGGGQDTNSDVGGDDTVGGGDADASGDAGADTSDLCPGGPNCKCDKNDDCDNAVCIWQPGGKRCATPCTTSCESGFSCNNVSTGSDAYFACVSNQLSLCSPCEKDGDCTVNGISAACVDYGANGKFCGAPCATNADCPKAYACEENGGKTKQCKLQPTLEPGSGKACAKDDECDEGEACGADGKCAKSTPGQCECSPWSVDKGLTTTCSQVNAEGTCKGTRTCGVNGLTACDAPAAEAESCNAKDDDCDGVTDNLAKDYKCSKRAFKATGSLTACKTDGDCGVAGEKCDETDGKCKTLIGECFGTPSCTNGGQLLCNDAKTPKSEQCNLDDDDCDGATDEDFVWLQGAATLTVGSPCGLGACAGGQVVCQGLSKAVCDTANKIGVETCDAIDNDCDGTTDNAALVCDDKDACTKNVCEGAAKQCTNPAAVNCDDGEQCTTDGCNKADGKCLNTPYTGSCDDGNACTVGDLCGVNAGKPTCLAGSVQKVCDDANLCTNDSCEPKTGCVQLPNSATQACYSGPKDTSGVGTCKGGAQFCKAGTLDTACVGEFTPNTTEKCDGLDDDCNGKTDDGCSAKGVRFTFATGALIGEGGKKKVRMRLGGESNAGVAVGTKQTGRFGFIAWIRSVLK